MSPQRHSSTRSVFISHITEEKPVAWALKEFIEDSFEGQVRVFVSSHIDGIKLGDKWFREIEKALESCRVFLILCSPSSLTRPWINFEAGYGWKGRAIIPICHLGQSKSQLPPPFRDLQGLDLDDEAWGETLLEALAIRYEICKVPGIQRKKLSLLMNKARNSMKRSVPLQIIHSQEERTKLLNHDLQMLRKNAVAHKGKIWMSAFLSAFASGSDDPYPPEKGKYLRLVLQERKLLLGLARKGCEIKCIISPANEHYVRHIGPSGVDRAIRRTRTLIGFLTSKDRALAHIDWAVSELGIKNLYIIGDISYIEGYKTGLEPGYGLTLRQTSRDFINANVELYEHFFRNLAAQTIQQCPVRDGHYSASHDLSRIGAIHCLEKSLQFLTNYYKENFGERA